MFPSCLLLLSELQQLELFSLCETQRCFCGLEKNATSASVEDSIFPAKHHYYRIRQGVGRLPLPSTKTSHLSELFLWRKQHLFSFSFLFCFFKPSPSHRSQASCCSACTRGLLRFRLCENKEMQNVPVRGGLRRGWGGVGRLKGKR